MKVIKRYSNRKLYDSEISKYINLKTLVVDCLQNRDFMVVDNESHRDVTIKTLMEGFHKYAKIDETTIRELIKTFVGENV